MSPEMRRWLWIPLSVLFLSLYLVGIRIYQHRLQILEPPKTVLTEEELQDMKVMEGEVVNINTADIKELMRLPGIGEVTAKRICEVRQTLGKFRSLEELKAVKGIGESLFLEIKEYIVLE